MHWHVQWVSLSPPSLSPMNEVDLRPTQHLQLLSPLYSHGFRNEDFKLMGSSLSVLIFSNCLLIDELHSLKETSGPYAVYATFFPLHITISNAIFQIMSIQIDCESIHEFVTSLGAYTHSLCDSDTASHAVINRPIWTRRREISSCVISLMA